MAVKLYRCSITWLKGPHPCWQVQKALDEAGIEYEVVRGPLRRSKRAEYEALTGQRLYPGIVLEDGTAVKRDHKELVAMIRSGELQAQAGATAAQAPPQAAPPPPDQEPPPEQQEPPEQQPPPPSA